MRPAQRTQIGSDRAVDCDSQRRAHLAHPFFAESPEPLNEDGSRHALLRIEIDGAESEDGVDPGLQDDLAREATDRRRARRRKRST